MDPVDIKNRKNRFPQHPGVYIFKDKNNKPLYIGKAINLRNRILNYSRVSDPRIKKMVRESLRIDTARTDSEIEALILESQYIKKFKPFFNVVMRDDKEYFYVGFDNQKFPKIFLTHQPSDSQNKIHGSYVYIGPFTDGNALKITLRILRKIFPYCTCKQKHHNYCLNYHIEKCLGFCCLKNEVNSDDLKIYKKNINAIKSILSGKRSSLIKDLEKEMRLASAKQNYEKSIEIQNKIVKVKRIFENAKIINYKNAPKIKGRAGNILKLLAENLGIKRPINRIESYDIANIQGKHAVGVMTVFTEGLSDKKEYRKFKITSGNTPNDVAMLREIFTRRLGHPEWNLPDLIVIDGGKAQFNAIKSLLNSCKLSVPIISVAKNEKHIGEKIFIDNKKDPVLLSDLPIDIRNFLVSIDSETHRFAISYYRFDHRKKIKKN